MLKSSASRLKDAIVSHRNDISKKDIAESPAFLSLLVAGLNAIFRFHKMKKNNIDVNVVYDETSGMTAFTDNFSIYMNAAHPLFRLDFGEEVTLKEFFSRLLGTIFHEVGHILYTPFLSYKKRVLAFQEGVIASGSIVLTREEQKAFDELALLMKENKMRAIDPSSMKRVEIRRLVISIYQNLFNIVEDGRIEKLLLAIDSMFSGFWNGLKTLRKAHFRSIDSFSEYEEDIFTFFNLCLAYAKYGDTKKYDGNFEAFERAKPIIDEMLNCNIAEEFFDLNTRLLLCIWPMIKDLLQEDDESDGAGEGEGESKEAEGSMSDGEGEPSEGEPGGGEGSSGSGKPKEGGDESSEESGRKLTEEEIEKINEKIREMLSRMEKEESSKMPDRSSDPSGTGAPSEMSSSGEPKGSGSSIESVLDSLKNDIAEEKARKEFKKAADSETKIMTENACAPKGYRSTVHTDNYPPRDAERIIDEVNATVGKSIDKAAREIIRHCEQDMRTGTSRHKIYGSRFHAEDLVNKDYKYFSSTSTQKDLPDMALGLVIDESGSMSWHERDETARASAICLYELFEKIPRMDIAVFGHSADIGGSGVDIFPYVDFGVKEKDALRKLTAIHARANNLDVIPMKLMAEKLLKQPVDMRMMIIISDGLPAAHGYGGERACQELKETADHYSHQGIEIIAAAIGDDKDRIKEIYKGQRFLDITDLSKLPMELVSVIKRKM